MRNKYIFLVAAVLSVINFIGFLSETEPQNMFGYDINIWVYRMIWLIATTYFSIRFYRMYKAEKE